MADRIQVYCVKDSLFTIKGMIMLLERYSWHEANVAAVVVQLGSRGRIEQVQLLLYR